MEKDELMRPEVVAIGGSAGSLEVVMHMLGHIHTRKLAMIVVLHRKSVPDSLLAEVMAQNSLLHVKEAEEKEPIRPGTVYLAPADYHLLVEQDRTLSLDYSEKVNFSRPSIDVTFESVAQVYGRRAVGMLLSGGNADGVAGLRRIRQAGGICVIQDPLTAEIAFMPETAVSSSAANIIVKSDELAAFINRLA